MNNNNNHQYYNQTNPSNESNTCQCEKENLSNRKRNRLNSYPMRRFPATNFCENCQIKRNKYNYRSKYSSNRSSKQRSNNRSHDPTSISTKFSVDLTGLNISYTIEYHDNLKCTCSSSTSMTYPTSSHNRCKCSSMNDWPLFVMMNSINDYNRDWYYYDTNNHNWFTPMFDSSIYNYNDFYLTRNDHPRMNNSSVIYFDEQTIFEGDEHSPAYYLRCITPTIEFERKKITNQTESSSPILILAIQSPPSRSWLRLDSPNPTQPTAIFTVMNYNILCDKYASQHAYGYCPSWALKWEYRRMQILNELRSYAADIIALQVCAHNSQLDNLERTRIIGVQEKKTLGLVKILT